MNKTITIYLCLLLVIFGLIIAAEQNTPKPIHWSPTYAINDKNPLGLYVFNAEMPTYFQDQKISTVTVSPYTFLEKHTAEDSETLMSVSDLCAFDQQSVNKICAFVRQGNNAFLSATLFPNELLDSLKLKMDSEVKWKEKPYNWVVNPKLSPKKYNLNEGNGNNYFSKIDTLQTTVLGYQSGDSTRVNFIKIALGKGSFFLHTQPNAFSNFHLLKANHAEYAQQVLSYVPKTNLLWYVKDQNGAVISDSPMRYILKQPALKWAWYFFLIGMILFIVFNVKRKQRIIPIITPLANTTVEFTKTIANLYYQEGDYDTVINKKIVFFLEKIRTDYYLDTTFLNEDFAKKLQIKSGKSPAVINNLLYLINNHRRSPHNSIDSDLIAINKAIEAFWA